MKKTIILILSITIFSCEQNTVEVSKSAGEWMMQGSVNQGKKYVMGDDKDADLVKEFMDAYEDMNAEKMVQMSADTVKFHPCLLYTSPSPRDKRQSRMPSSA